MLVLVAPGQGAQAPGFLTPWLDVPGTADRLAAWSDAIGLDLVHYGTKADADAIRDTAVAQPLLVAAGLLSAAALDLLPPTAGGPSTAIAPDIVAGHSVGEITAAVFAGVLDATAALTFVRERGLAMAEAAAITETGMAALLGGDPDVVLPHLQSLGLTAANVNGAGQIVAAGTAQELAALAENKPQGVFKVVLLKVAGAFHTSHMAPAVERLTRAAEDLKPADPTVTYVSNRDGRTVGTGREIVDRLVGQVANPVRWDQCMETFRAQGATGLVEVCPGGTLAGLAKRALSGMPRVALKTPADLDAARALVRECSTTAPKASRVPASQVPPAEEAASPGGAGVPAADTTV